MVSCRHSSVILWTLHTRLIYGGLRTNIYIFPNNSASRAPCTRALQGLRSVLLSLASMRTVGEHLE